MSQIWLGRNDPAEGAACLEHFVASFRSWKIKLNWAQLSLTELNWVQSVKGMGRPALIRRIYAISSDLLCYSGNWESQICGWISDNAMKNMFDKGCLLSAHYWTVPIRAFLRTCEQQQAECSLNSALPKWALLLAFFFLGSWHPISWPFCGFRRSKLGSFTRKPGITSVILTPCQAALAQALPNA